MKKHFCAFFNWESGLSNSLEVEPTFESVVASKWVPIILFFIHQKRLRLLKRKIHVFVLFLYCYWNIKTSVVVVLEILHIITSWQSSLVISPKQNPRQNGSARKFEIVSPLGVAILTFCLKCVENTCLWDSELGLYTVLTQPSYGGLNYTDMIWDIEIIYTTLPDWEITSCSTFFMGKPLKELVRISTAGP